MSTFKTASGHVTIIPASNNDGGGGELIAESENAGGTARVYAPSPEALRAHQASYGALPSMSEYPALPAGASVREYPALSGASVREQPTMIGDGVPALRRFLQLPSGGNRAIEEVQEAARAVLDENDRLKRMLPPMASVPSGGAAAPIEGAATFPLTSDGLIAEAKSETGGHARIYAPNMNPEFAPARNEVKNETVASLASALQPAAPDSAEARFKKLEIE